MLKVDLPAIFASLIKIILVQHTSLSLLATVQTNVLSFEPVLRNEFRVLPENYELLGRSPFYP